MNKLDRRNMIFFGLGTVGRDMFYALEANALIYYLSNVLDLPLGVFVATSMVFTVLRVFDALNDPIMGLLVDNTRSRHGRFKPPMALGALAGGACYLVLFADFGLRDYWFVAVFAIAYILWDIFYGLNDIAYWSMLPSLSVEQKTREKMGRLCPYLRQYRYVCHHGGVGADHLRAGQYPQGMVHRGTGRYYFDAAVPAVYPFRGEGTQGYVPPGGGKDHPARDVGGSDQKTTSCCGRPLPCRFSISAT